jgi:hypothetical protein
MTISLGSRELSLEERAEFCKYGYGWLRLDACMCLRARKCALAQYQHTLVRNLCSYWIMEFKQIS